MQQPIDFTPIFRQIAQRVLRSIEQNFREGGRPVKWKPSSRTKIGSVSQADRKTRFGKTLIHTGTLKNSIQTKVSSHGVEVSTNVVYAKTHHFGDQSTITQNIRPHKRTINQTFGRYLTKPIDVNVRGHSRSVKRNIPARPFLMLHESDKSWIQRTIMKFLDNQIRSK